MKYEYDGVEYEGDDFYCYPDTKVLMNRLNIRDYEILQAAERDFSYAKITKLQNQNYLGHVIPSVLDAIVGSAEHRNAMILFKLAVEMSMMTHVMASQFDITKGELYKLRAHCVREVKEIKGRIGLENARKFQREDGVTDDEMKIYNQSEDGEEGDWNVE